MGKLYFLLLTASLLAYGGNRQPCGSFLLPLWQLDALAPLFQKLRALNPHTHNDKKLKHEVENRIKRTNGELIKGSSLTLTYGKKVIAIANGWQKNSTLRFEFSIKNSLQEPALISFFLDRLQVIYPSVKVIPCNFAEGSDESKLFFTKVKELSKSAAYRESILEAAYAMDDMRAREAVGLGKLSKIIIDENKESAFLVSQLGNRIPDAEVGVFFVADPPYRLMVSGKKDLTISPNDLEFGDDFIKIGTH